MNMVSWCFLGDGTILFYIFLTSYVAAQQIPPAQQCLETEKKVLLEFRKAAMNLNKLSSWEENTDCCSWQGVSCQLYPLEESVTEADQSGSAEMHVFKLSLPGVGLGGALPSVLGQLVFLEHLNLSANQFNGSIPNELSSLKKLKVMDVSNNNFSGSITIFDHMELLEKLSLSSNSFSGELPTYKNLIHLEEFYGDHNILQGGFPTDICNYSTQLKVLDFSSNGFSGPLPAGLGRCSQLQELHLGSNQLSGFIPEDVFHIISLSVLCLENNSFIGELRDSVSNLHNLTTLVLCYNNMSGHLPRSLSQNTKLYRLLLCCNNFTGSLDLDFSNLPLLEELDLNNNALTGVIPSTLQSCKGLRVLTLSKNNFSSQIPDLSSLKNLTTVYLSSNQLAGTLDAVVNNDNLVSLILTKNHFSESLPSTVSGLKNLQILALGYLNLRGGIPAWLQNCTKLQVLDLSWNHLDGEIPEWLGSLHHLMYLELSNNSFTGVIPKQLFDLASMMHNDTDTSGLQDVEDTLDVKRQSSSRGLKYNKVVSLPTSLYLSSNHLIGSIPAEIGRLTALSHLDLSCNDFNGTIPDSLSDLKLLELLDLSFNHLVGCIPHSLTQLTFLGTFNVSYNNLSGLIPMGNQFSSFLNTSYLGNDELCGAPILRGCPDVMSQSFPLTSVGRSRSAYMKMVLVFISAGVTVTVLLLACLSYARKAAHQRIGNSRDMRRASDISESRSESVQFFRNSQKLGVEDILRATNNFDAANIVGCGGFGLVYKAELGDGSCLAIKKLTGDSGEMEREFRAEVDVLSKVQHRNLVSLQGYLHLGNEKLLIYSYMENGSLDYWLHERNDGRLQLDWAKRLKIAQGAAAGLAYLHQICVPHIVHRDIKSSNILLDDQFEAHLADFGLARLLMATDTHVSTELVGTLGYIPPEYADATNATKRGDIYSFGVVLLELLTGRRPVDVCKLRGCCDLIGWIEQMRKENKLDEVLDSYLDTRFQQQMKHLLDVASQCTLRNPRSRPSIKDVVNWLNEIGGHKNQEQEVE